MTQLIIGPGAMGGLLGIKLASQQAVMLAGRRPLPSPQSLTSPQGSTTQHAVDGRLAAALTERDLSTITTVHLLTKAYAAESALAEVATRLPAATPLVLWQNGLEVQPRLTRDWPGPTLCASTTEGAYRQSDTHIVHAGQGHTWIGHLEGEHASLAAELADTLTRAGLASQAVDDIHQRLWHKLAVNAAINPVVARYRIRNGRLAEPRFAPITNAIIAEVADIMHSAGIALPARGLSGLVWQVIEDTAHNRASMLQDVLAGRTTEHDAILLPLLRLAREHHRATPCLAAFHRYFSQRSATG